MALSLSLADLVARLGPGVVRLPAGVRGDDVDVQGIQVHDPLRPVAPHPGDVVLGVGVSVSDAEQLASELQRAGAAGLVVKAAAEELTSSSAPVVVANPVVDWGRLLTLAHTALDPGDGSASLFALCDAAADRCGGAVVLHDARFRLLAYSSGQDLSDHVRRDTILGRAAPADAVAHLSETGAIERLAAGEVVILEGEGPLAGAPERVGVGVRTEAELLGTLWVQLSPGRPPAEAALRECAETIAVVLVRRRQSLAESARREDELLELLLTTGDGADELTAALGGSPAALGVLAGVSLPARSELQRSVVADRFAMLVRGFATAYRFSMCTALVGERLYALRVLRAGEPVEQAGRHVDQLHAQLTRLGVGRVVTAVGDPAPVRAVPTIRKDVDRLLTVLLDSRTGLDVGRVSEHRSAVELAGLREAVLADGGELPDGPVRRLLVHDAERGGPLVDTLRAWFDCNGDTALVAERLTLHVNTVRYRLRRMAEVAGLDLTDPEQRFLAEVHLRLRVD